MLFPAPLVRGTLVSRYKRFFADVALDDGTHVTAHCPNPGAMLGLKTPGMPVWLSRSSDPKRKLAWTLELVEACGGLVGVNTMNPNRLAWEAIAEGRIPELAGYARMRREVAYDGDSRIDILLEDDERAPCWVEVKNSHFLRTPGLAEFPDCVTVRGVKHLKALERRVEAGERAVMLFCVQVTGVTEFDTADDIDKGYGPALREAAANGVEVIVYGCALGAEGIHIDRPMRWRGAGRPA
ncbi:MAG TPA: DNA/RNA nuclease SfsA [Caulobacteraceae bacterium]|nr:DNA/RNA nuclease SfsA [Caulobacteraceae bacterium]